MTPWLVFSLARVSVQCLFGTRNCIGIWVRVESMRVEPDLTDVGLLVLGMVPISLAYKFLFPYIRNSTMLIRWLGSRYLTGARGVLGYRWRWLHLWKVTWMWLTYLTAPSCRFNSAGLIAGLFRLAFSLLFSVLVSNPHIVAHIEAESYEFIATMALSAEQRFDLIKENLGEVLNPELIESILKEGRNPRVYWGKDRPHPHAT